MFSISLTISICREQESEDELLSIVTNIRQTLNRRKIYDSEELQREDLLKNNKDKIEDISQRQGLLINSGLSDAEKQYILSDSVISSAIQIYLADITSICDKQSVLITSSNDIKDEFGENAKKEEIVKFVFNQVYTNQLTESIIIDLLNNGEIFLDTKYNKGLNQYFVNETPYSKCTQLCYANGEPAVYAVSNEPETGDNLMYTYSYSIRDVKNKLVKPEFMARIYNPALANSKVCIELEKDNQEDEELLSISNGNYLYYNNSLSLLKQVYSDWLNSKLLELAVYRDRIAKSRFIQLIAIELGRTSRITSDQIYDNVKDYFDKRAVIDLEQQTFKSVVGNEPFTDYKVYTTRNGNGALSFDNSLNGQNANVAELADLDYNLNKVFAGLGIPKQYLGADDTGSALSNGTSLFFIDEKYQKRVISYVKRIADGYKQCIKNLIIQRESTDKERCDFFDNWDFELEFAIPESNEDVMRVKNAKIEYVNALLELCDKLDETPDKYNIDTISSIIGEDLGNIRNTIIE